MTAISMDKPQVIVGETMGQCPDQDLLLHMFSGFMLYSEIHASEAPGAGTALTLARRARRSTALDTDFLRFGTSMMGSPFLMLLWCRELFT